MKDFAVTVLLSSYDEQTVRKEVFESLNKNYSLNNIDVYNVEEIED